MIACWTNTTWHYLFSSGTDKPRKQKYDLRVLCISLNKFCQFIPKTNILSKGVNVRDGCNFRRSFIIAGRKTRKRKKIGGTLTSPQSVWPRSIKNADVGWWGFYDFEVFTLMRVAHVVQTAFVWEELLPRFFHGWLYLQKQGVEIQGATDNVKPKLRGWTLFSEWYLCRNEIFRAAIQMVFKHTDTWQQVEQTIENGMWYLSNGHVMKGRKKSQKKSKKPTAAKRSWSASLRAQVALPSKTYAIIKFEMIRILCFSWT